MTRDRTITIRVNEFEEAKIAQQARLEELTVSTFIRRKLLKQAKAAERIHAKVRYVGPTIEEEEAQMDSSQLAKRTLSKLPINHQY